MSNSTATVAKQALGNLPHDWRQMAALGLEYRGECPHCGDLVCRVEWPVNKTSCCDKPYGLTPELDVQEVFKDWAEEAQVGYERAVEAYERSIQAGVGDWGTFEMFQLHPNDPLRKEVNSMAEYRAACKARYIDPDTHKPTKDNPKHGSKENFSWA